jgi:hypothetical protein
VKTGQRRRVGEEPSHDALMGIVRALRSAGAGVVRVIEAQSSGYGMPQSSGQRHGLPS